jgi:hypothetical protein
MEICALCRTPGRRVVESHIFSEFLYSGLYNDHNKYLQISTDPSVRAIARPKGIYEKLLCAECDNEYFGELEGSASKVLKAIETQLESTNEDLILKVDYKSFKLFQLSVLWRLSVSCRPEFRSVHLGPNEERVRRLLVDRNPGDSDAYSCLLMASVVDPDFKQTILFPEIVRIGHHRACRMLVRGVWWIYRLVYHPHHSDWPIISLTEDGSLQVHREFHHTQEFLRQLKVALVSHPTLQATAKKYE